MSDDGLEATVIRILGMLPAESPVDLDAHARKVALIAVDARRRADELALRSRECRAREEASR